MSGLRRRGFVALDRLQSFGLLRDIDAQNGIVTAVISTGDVARDDAIVSPNGWDFGNYDHNPVVLWMHDDATPPVARTVEKLATETELIAKAQFDMEDPLALRILSKIERGFINATSIRWLPKRWEFRKLTEPAREVLVFLEQELLEWSFVSVPADPKALILRADGAPLSRDAFLPVAPVEPEVASPPAPGRETILDELEYLRDSLARYGIADLFGRLSNADMELARAVHAQLGELLGAEHKPQQGANTLREIEDQVAAYLERRLERPSVDDIVVRTMAAATGRSEDLIRKELRHA